MSAEISCHDTTAIKAKAVSHKNTDWIELALVDSTGQSLEITAFFARRGDAQVYADAINQAFAVVEPPDVQSSDGLECLRPEYPECEFPKCECA